DVVGVVEDVDAVDVAADDVARPVRGAADQDAGGGAANLDAVAVGAEYVARAAQAEDVALDRAPRGAEELHIPPVDAGDQVARSRGSAPAQAGPPRELEAPAGT